MSHNITDFIAAVFIGKVPESHVEHVTFLELHRGESKGKAEQITENVRVGAN